MAVAAMRVFRCDAHLEQLFWHAVGVLEEILEGKIGPDAERRLHVAEVVLKTIAGGTVPNLSEDVSDPATPNPH
jgi:hypothetical protein